MRTEGRWLLLDEVLLDPAVEGLEALAAHLRAHAPSVSAVLLGEVRSLGGPLDAPALLGALAAMGVSTRLGALISPGRGRAVSVAVRELTTVDHLAPGGAALLLAGAPVEQLVEGALVAAALQAGAPATAGGSVERVRDAPNLPAPRSAGGMPIAVLGPAELSGRLPRDVELLVMEGDDLVHGGRGDACILEVRRGIAFP